MGVIPEVRIKPLTTKLNSTPGMAGITVVIGAFEKAPPNLVSCASLREFRELFGTSKDYDGNAAVEQMFRTDGGVSAVIPVNITTKTDAEPPATGEVIQKELTAEKLTAALLKIKGERFDILFVAATLTDDGLKTCKDFIDESYDLQKPNGLITAIKYSTSAAAIDSAKIFETGGLYGLTCQQWTVNGKQLSFVETAAYYCGIVAGRKVDESMTMQELPGVTAVTTDFNYSEEEDGNYLVDAGVTVARCMDRVNNTYVIVNSEQPSGLDLYIERTKDFIIKGMQLEDYLGRKNVTKSLTGIRSALETKKQTYVATYELLEDIGYSIEKTGVNCVAVSLDSLTFAGIITKIDVYVVVEVE